MTITVNDTRDEYTSGAGQTVFNYTFKIFADTDLNVYQTPAGQDPDDSTDIITAYTVAGAGDEDGGSITLTVGASAGDLITIVSDIPSSRTTDYQNNGDYLPDTVNDDFDRVVSLVKQVEDVANRTVVLEQSQQGPKPLSLPSPESLKFLRWKTDLTGFENVPAAVSSTVPVATLSSYDDLADAVSQIGATLTEVWIDQNDVSNATVPSNIFLRFIPSNLLSGTVTIYSPGNIIAFQTQQIFSAGNDNINFSNGSSLSPYWFGAKGDYNETTETGTDDSAAFQTTVDCLVRNYMSVLDVMAGGK